jgi:PKD repeat protein
MASHRTGKILLFIGASLIFCSMCFAGTLPATFFGMHINHSTTAWPSVTFGSYRVWDDGGSWANINTSRGVYNWGTLDSWVSRAQQQNVQLTYTFGRTPTWASSSPTTSCNYAPGECVAPADYTNWDNFVTALATRYKGKIKYYEMWNEPNDTGFWKGTTAQLVEMTSRAANIIHSIDPNAEVESPGATWTSTTAWAWLDGYLTAGAGPYLDDIGFHGYTGNNNAEGILSIIDNIEKTQNAHGLSLPLMITEGGWGLNSVITNQDAQAAFLVQRYLLITSRPAVKSFFWYQWDNTSWGTLWDSTSGIHTPGVAYGQLASWLIGASANGCSKNASSTWTCSYTLANGSAALAVWNATASGTYTPGSQYTQVRAIDGSSSSITGSNPYTIGSKPVLFTATSTSVAATSATLAVTPGTGIAPVAVSASVAASVPSGVTVKSTSIAFGDGTTVNAATGSHTYANAGAYTVLATVTDSLNRTATSSKTVTVSAPQAPQAALSVSPGTGKIPLAVTASSAASTDPGGTIVSSSINFGDGTVLTGSTSAHTYTAAGTYTVTATVKDSLGLSSTATVTVTAAANQPPVAKLALSQSGMTVTASTAGSYDPDGTIASTVINWGDGASTNAASGSHTYAAAGTYTVTATVTDNSGASNSATQSAIVPNTNKPPVAVMTLTQTADVSYNVSTTGSYDPDGTIVSTVINWGDGSTTAAASGSHTYSKAGTYTVTVTVTDNHGATASTSGSATASWGIFVVSPKSASTSGSPVQFVAYAASAYGIRSTKILVDGKTVYSGTSWLISTYVRMAHGTRSIVLQAIDNSGVLYQSSFSITVQ